MPKQKSNYGTSIHDSIDQKNSGAKSWNNLWWKSIEQKKVAIAQFYKSNSIQLLQPQSGILKSLAKSSKQIIVPEQDSFYEDARKGNQSQKFVKCISW